MDGEERNRPLKEITHADYKSFIASHDRVVIEDVEVALPHSHTIKKFAPRKFERQTTTVWSFPDRGDWATHRGNYRGNWSPYIPRNLIDRYSAPGETVLDQMMGSGTTLVECRLMGRNAVGVDVNPDAVMVARNRLDFPYGPLDEGYVKPAIKTYVGDARSLDKIKDSSIDLVATHPPYASIIPYSRERVGGDLSYVHDIGQFAEEMRRVAEESMRVLKAGRHCAILMGDTRKHAHFVPITPRVLKAFLDAGFVIREDVIKLQHKMKSTRETWFGKNYNFLLLAHEHLYVFRKLGEGESERKYKGSASWK